LIEAVRQRVDPKAQPIEDIVDRLESLLRHDRAQHALEQRPAPRRSIARPADALVGSSDGDAQQQPADQRHERNVFVNDAQPDE
jgi:hypothetical protein